MVAQALRAEKPTDHLQRALCDVPARAAAEARLAKATASSDPVAAARLRSASAPGVAAIFAPTPGVDDDMWHRLPTLWLAPNLFTAALRLHLGLAVLPAQGRCPFCNTTREGLEQHALDCMRGGGRQRAHTSIKQAAFVAASAAQWAPRLESSPFVGSTGRIDIDCFWLGERLLGDTAIVSVSHSLAAATGTPGGAATAYEATKHAKYDAAAAETDRTMQVMPLVWDTFGAAGETAASFTRRVAIGAAHRFSVPHSRVIGIMRERLAARVVAGIRRC